MRLRNLANTFGAKPMATSMADARAMVSVAQEHGVKTMLGYNRYEKPKPLASKTLIVPGHIGEITHFNGIYLEDFMCDPNVPHSWRLTKKGGGKGALGDMAAT